MKSQSSPWARLNDFDRGRAISGTVAINCGGAVLSAVTSIIFARILGITNYGLYVYVISATGLIGGIATLGLPTLITRETAAWASLQKWQEFNGIIRFGIIASLVSSSLCGLCLLVCGPLLGRITATPDFYAALSLGAGIMILQCLDATIAGALQGMDHVAQSLLPQGIIVPACLIIFMFVANIMRWHLNAIGLLSAQLGIGCIAEVYQLLSLHYRRPAECIGEGYINALSTWLTNSLPFWGNGILFIINVQADTLLLGYFRGGNSAAIYLVGTRGAQVIVLVLGAIAAAIQPRIAGLHNRGDDFGVSRLVTQTTRLGFGIAMIGSICFFAFGESLIRLLYGEPFIAATSVLLILVIARLINASVGSLGPYLAMTGKELLLFKMLAIESIANVVLNIVLIPKWGMNGSAVATGISMAVVNLALAVHVYKEWGIDVSVFGLRIANKMSEVIPIKGP